MLQLWSVSEYHIAEKRSSSGSKFSHLNNVFLFHLLLFRAVNGRRDSKQFLPNSNDSEVFTERETVCYIMLRHPFVHSLFVCFELILFCY